MSDLEERVAALEEAVARLAARPHDAPPPATSDDDPDAPGADAADGRFWMLSELARRHPDGAVGFAGAVPLPTGEARWQWGRPSGDLLHQEWDDASTPLAALGHPVRLRLLRLVLTGTTTTADLTHAEGLGTAGQLHHHLRTLVAAGWLASAGRGRYEVPAHRAVPLLVILAATLPA